MARERIYFRVNKDLDGLLYTMISYANRGIPRNEFLQENLKLLMPILKCDVVVLQLLAGEKVLRYEAQATRKKSPPYKLRVSQYKKEEICSVENEPDGYSDLERLSGYILQNQYRCSGSSVSKNGSFFTQGSRELYEISILHGKNRRTYLFHPGKNHRSFAVIPLLANEVKLGVLQLKSRKIGFFTKDSIEFYETIAASIALAALVQKRHSSLRERVKELGCLYGIARLIGQSDLTMEEILGRTVKLLPPAWLYPDVAAAKITLNGHRYATKSFRERAQKQSADIVIDGECRGAVEVVYLNRRPELDEGPFLTEERNLINAVARQIALIVERRHAEQEQKKLQEQLRHADRLATVGQLSAGVAHELNEPLASILGFAELANDCPGLPDQVANDIAKIVKASLFAREIVKKLLFFSRQVPQKKTTVNLNQVVREGLFFLESRCAKEGIMLVCSLDPDLPQITADSGQMQQVLINLVVNAIQAMPQGGELKVKTLSLENDGMLIVEDNGIGMSEEIQRQLFTPFFTTKEVDKGTGLGLPVVYGIVTAHGGSINVSSKLGQGSRFEISLPMTKQERDN